MALQEPKLARAVVAVLEHPGSAYSVDSLATLAGMSEPRGAAKSWEETPNKGMQPESCYPYLYMLHCAINLQLAFKIGLPQPGQSFPAD